MALNKTIKIDHVSYNEDKVIHVRTATIIDEDGIEISRHNHRHIVIPGQDTTNEDQEVKDLAALIHTQAVIDAYNAKINS